MLEEDGFDFGYDDNCYETNCSSFTMWYLRALKTRKAKGKNGKKHN